MNKLFEEAGRTVRHAVGRSDRTVRLCLLILVLAAAWWLAHH